MMVTVNYAFISVATAILPALIVAVVLFLRQEAMRGAISDAVRTAAAVSADAERMRVQILEVEGAAHAASVAGHDLKLNLTSIEESFVALSNKWNSRDRATAEKERREQAKSKPDPLPDNTPVAELINTGVLHQKTELPPRQFGTLRR
jgi:hypothetical protein